MKIPKTKSTTTSSNINNTTPFFKKREEGTFFSTSQEMDQPFFKPSTVSVQKKSDGHSKQCNCNGCQNIQLKSKAKNNPVIQKKSDGHSKQCNCNGCQNIQLKSKAKNTPVIQKKSDGHSKQCNCNGCQTIQLKSNSTTPSIQKQEAPKEANKETTKESSDPYAPTYLGKALTVTKNAQILSKGTDKHQIGTFKGTKEVIGKKYAFEKRTIPFNSEVKLVEEATSYDSKNKPNTKVAKVTVVSIPKGITSNLKDSTVWTTRSNVSKESTENSNYTIIDKNANTRTSPKDITADKEIPKGTLVNITDVHYINDFPEDYKLKNNSERNSFHSKRYMKLYINVCYEKDGKEISGWISANDVGSEFANEVLGTSNVSKDSLESNDPSHKTIGTKKTDLLTKGGKTYSPTEISIAKGTYVSIDSESSDKKYVKVSSEDGSVTGQWTSVGNLDKSKKKEIKELAITYYEITDSKAIIRNEKQGYKPSGESTVLGDFVKIHSSEDSYVEISKVTRSGDKRIEDKNKYWIDSAHLADGWSTDLHGQNASWGVQVIGGARLTKYKGQDDLVNLSGSGGKMKQVSKTAFPNLMKMINAAKNNVDSKGKADPINIIINSCFRTYFSQKYFDDNEKKPGFNSAAPPGRSDHQDSNAFDLNNLRSTKVYTWLKNNAYKYDIIQNVHKSNERHHWAYIPGKGTKGVYTTWGTKSNKSW